MWSVQGDISLCNFLRILVLTHDNVLLIQKTKFKKRFSIFNSKTSVLQVLYVGNLW